MSQSSEHPARRLTRPAQRVRAAARPIAVASVVALSSTGLGMVAVPAAQASRVQQRLVHEGYLSDADVSGRYDPRTGAAVARWQADRGLRADGLVDTATADVLLGIPHHSIPRSSGR